MRKKALELWCDIPLWEFWRFFCGIVGEAKLSSEETMGECAEETRYVEEEGLGARSKLSLPIGASDSVVPVTPKVRALDLDAGKLLSGDGLLHLIRVGIELRPNAQSGLFGGRLHELHHGLATNQGRSRQFCVICEKRRCSMSILDHEHLSSPDFFPLSIDNFDRAP